MSEHTGQTYVLYGQQESDLPPSHSLSSSFILSDRAVIQHSKEVDSHWGSHKHKQTLIGSLQNQPCTKKLESKFGDLNFYITC